MKTESGEGKPGESDAAVAVYYGEAPQEAASALEAAVIILSVMAVFIWLVLR